MKKANIFLGLFILPVLVILFTAGCRRDENDSTKGAARVISGIVMDQNHNPVINGEVHLITPEGRGEFLGWCERTETIVKTDGNGYFEVGIGHDCRVVDEVDMLVFNEEGVKVDKIYAKLELFTASQDHINGAGFNSPDGMFFPDRLSYFTNYVAIKSINNSEFDVEDTLYFLLPADPWENKFWHIMKMPLVDFVGTKEFTFRFTNELNYFLTYSMIQPEYHLFVTDDSDLAGRSKAEIGELPPVSPRGLKTHNPIVLDFEMIEYPHQKIGGENRIYLTVKKENGKIVVEEQD